MEKVTLAQRLARAMEDVSILINEFIASEIRPKITRYKDGRIRINKPFSFSKEEADDLVFRYDQMSHQEPGLIDPLDSYLRRKD